MIKRIVLRPVARLAALLVLAACSQPDTKPAKEVVITEASFRCIREMTPVRGLFVDNLLGNVAATVAVAQSPAGKTYPPGSLIQVIPTVAMVNHQAGRSPETNDWEFVELGVTAEGTRIIGRGFAELNMSSGPRQNCFGCHQPAKANWDLVCEQDHGCLPIPMTQAMIRDRQNTDPRCAKTERTD